MVARKKPPAPPPSRLGTWLTHRNTGDILLLLIAGTICFSVIAGGATVAVVEMVHPTTDTSQVINMISDVINTLIGLLAGFLAGRTDVQQARAQVDQAAQQARSGQESTAFTGRADV